MPQEEANKAAAREETQHLEDFSRLVRRKKELRAPHELMWREVQAR